MFFHPDDSFGPRLLQMCNQALFECLALNLHCLRGDQRALTAVINHRIVSIQFLPDSLTACFCSASYIHQMLAKDLKCSAVCKCFDAT